MSLLRRLVERKLEERTKQATQAIMGGLPSFADYRYHVGYSRGMYDLFEDISPLLRHPEDDDMEEGR